MKILLGGFDVVVAEQRHDLDERPILSGEEGDKEIRTDTIVVSKENNLYSSLKSCSRGSVINFYADHEGIDLRRTAADLKKLFFDKPPERNSPTTTSIPNTRILQASASAA